MKGCPFKYKCEEFNKLSIDEQECCDHNYEMCKIYQLYLNELIDYYGSITQDYG